MQDCAVVRLKEGRLAWYPPGAAEGPRFLDDDVVREQLRAAVNQPGSKVCFAAPGADVRLCQFDISQEEKKHLDKSLPFMLEEELIGDIEDLHFAWAIQDKLNLTAAICSRNNMQQWQNLLESFPGIHSWITEPMLLPWQPGEWCVVIEPDLVVVRTGFFEGFSIERALAVPMLAAANNKPELPEAIIVYGQDQEKDTALFSDELRAPIQWRRGDLGSALLLNQSPLQTPNLLQGKFAVQLPLARWWRQWRAVAAVFALAFCVQLAGTYTEFVSLERENTELRLAVEQSYRKAYPRGAMVDAEKQLSRQLGALRGSSQASGFVSLINRVGDVISRSPGTGIASINYNDKGDEIRMNITAKNFEAVDDFRTAMNSAGLSATMESSNAQGDQVRARMRVGAGS